jgi:hypothetical protein
VAGECGLIRDIAALVGSKAIRASRVHGVLGTPLRQQAGCSRSSMATTPTTLQILGKRVSSTAMAKLRSIMGCVIATSIQKRLQRRWSIVMDIGLRPRRRAATTRQRQIEIMPAH